MPGPVPARPDPEARRPMFTPSTAHEILRRMLDALEADTTLVPETSQAIREALPGYGEVLGDSLEASIRRNLALSIRTIREGRAPEAEHIGEAEELALERMEQGCRWAASWPASACA
ncbi:hypothetical protein H3H54_15620 [Brachybacterium sp. Z12]|uniref:hypothetical protein n=1 Tax=Brachybacterium sp. Z12 TaxID=2759167 RepID=UPI0018601ADD|nr:hypothetical protein [Brachybacterium sp. Z12]QNN82406.1 hypothetical protein H3H54_15620 [Brachybacterium sp. Z12]